MASGIAVLQVAANPLVTAHGPAESAPSRLTLAQTFNSLGTTVGPALGAWAILSHGPAGPADPGTASPEVLAAARQAEAAVLQTPFLVIAGGLALLAILFWSLRHRLPVEGGKGGRRHRARSPRPAAPALGRSRSSTMSGPRSPSAR